MLLFPYLGRELGPMAKLPIGFADPVWQRMER